jgi:hypothetical protein
MLGSWQNIYISKQNTEIKTQETIFFLFFFLPTTTKEFSHALKPRKASHRCYHSTIEITLK